MTRYRFPVKIIGTRYNEQGVFEVLSDHNNGRWTPFWVLNDVGEHQPFSRNITEIPFGTPQPESVSGLFKDFRFLENIEAINEWDFTRYTDLNRMFKNCVSLKNVDFSRCNLSNVESMLSIFMNCLSLERVMIRTDLSNLENLKRSFTNCFSLRYVDFGNNELQSLKDLDSAFINCEDLTFVNIPRLHPRELVNLDELAFKEHGVNKMFTRAQLKPTSLYQTLSYTKEYEIDLSNWDFSNTTSFEYAFYRSAELVSIKFPRMDINGEVLMLCVFADCSSLYEISVKSWNVSSDSDSQNMFACCDSFRFFVLEVEHFENLADLEFIFENLDRMKKFIMNEQYPMFEPELVRVCARFNGSIIAEI